MAGMASVALPRALVPAGTGMVMVPGGVEVEPRMVLGEPPVGGNVIVV